jgi:hypothetical protein
VAQAPSDSTPTQPARKRFDATDLMLLGTMMQAYLDESSVESDQFLEGLDVTLPAAIELFNDLLLYLNDGEAPPVKVGEE